jgi:dTDP-4-amino-4,6-dideoxygalactose transaminase
LIALNSPLKPDLATLQRYLATINSNGQYTNFGPLHNELTARLEDYLGVTNLLLVTNGTLALQVAAAALDVRSVLVSAFGFAATASAFQWQGIPVAFVDIDRDSYNLCGRSFAAAKAAGSTADAVVATHVYGNPCQVQALQVQAEKADCRLIYDAAHAFGVSLDKRSLVEFGDASILSFHATKVFHTAEGGAVVFRDRRHYDRARAIINFGIEAGQGVTAPGLNAKMSEYHAAIGLANLDVMDDVLGHRASLFHQYRQGLADVVEMPHWHTDASVNGAYMPIHLPGDRLLKLLIADLDEKKIGCRHYFAPALNQIYPQCENFGSRNSVAVAEGILCLPLHAYMSQRDVARVIECVKQVVR